MSFSVLQMIRSHRLFGAILLVAGCCIGAGMLGLPLVTAAAGFFPTTVAFVASWLFMAATGLLLLEVNLWFGTGNLMSLADRTLGKGARFFVGFLYLFLFYCLMVAYLAGGGVLITEYAGQIAGLEMSAYAGSCILVLLFGFFVFRGTRAVDLFNRLLMAGLAVSYAGLVLLGLPHMHAEHLMRSNWGYAIPALPAMIISFGYHNLVPSLTEYLEGNVRELRLAVIAGSAIPLIIYLIWNSLILGILPPGQEIQAAIDSGAMVTTLLKEAVGKSYVVDLMRVFAFLALVTSFLAVALSFVDFLADGMAVKKTKKSAFFLVSLVLMPPLVFTYIYPSLFLKALNYAGAFGAVILFGVIPVVMVWKGRYRDKQKGVMLVPGGKIALFALGSFALFVFLMQLKNELGI
jgi:tyrosine-specific transport protein